MTAPSQQATLPHVIMETIPNPLLCISAQGAITFANLAAEHFFHLSVRNLCRLQINDLVPFSSPLLSELSVLRERHISINKYDISIGTPHTGGSRIADIQLAAMPGGPDATIVMQIWPRSMAQQMDRQLTHRSAARTVTGMAAMLAHEIKNPLSGIRGAAQLLQPALEPGDGELCDLICRETDRIRDLVDQMEEFSDERPLERTSVNIHDVLDHVKRLAQSGFAQNLQIEEIYDPSLPAVLGNRDQLIQVMINLLKNAAEAALSGENGWISLQTAYKPGVHMAMAGSSARLSLPLEVKIANSGEPIPEDTLPHIFEPFVSSKANGKGLGLALVAKIIHDHGGIIEASSENGITQLRILLPRADNGPKEAPCG